LEAEQSSRRASRDGVSGDDDDGGDDGNTESWRAASPKADASLSLTRQLPG
jgi:hypothetical protein